MKDKFFEIEVQGIGKSGRLYNQAEIDRAGAADGSDPEAAAFAEDMHARPGDIDVEQLMQQIMHDCPDCRAARARGEQPIVVTGADMLGMRPPRKRKSTLRRWREQKRRR